MRILYCIDLIECKYVSVTNEIWIFDEDINKRYAKICFIDSCGSTYISEKMNYDFALQCLYEVVKSGYLNLENTLFELDEDE